MVDKTYLFAIMKAANNHTISSAQEPIDCLLQQAQRLLSFSNPIVQHRLWTGSGRKGETGVYIRCLYFCSRSE